MVEIRKLLTDLIERIVVEGSASKNPNDAIEALRKIFEQEPDTAIGEYVGLKSEMKTIDGVSVESYSIDDLLTDSILAEIKSTKITLDNISKILFDLNILFRRYQEKTIDSAKDGAIVPVPIEVSKYVKAKTSNLGSI